MKNQYVWTCLKTSGSMLEKGKSPMIDNSHTTRLLVVDLQLTKWKNKSKFDYDPRKKYSINAVMLANQLECDSIFRNRLISVCSMLNLELFYVRQHRNIGIKD